MLLLVLMIFAIWQDTVQACQTKKTDNSIKPKDLSLTCHAHGCYSALECACRFTSGKPKGEITWTLTRSSGSSYDMSRYSRTGYFSELESVTSSLHHSMERADEGGRVVCGVSNKKGSVTGTSYIGKKSVPVIFNNIDSQYAFTESSTVNIICSAAGSPRPDITWIHPDNTKSQGSTLTIYNIGREKEGVYTCIARNCAGYSRKQTQIIVHYSPECNSLNETKIVVGSKMMNSDVVIGCNISSNPSSTITWLIKKNNKLTKIQQNEIFHITELSVRNRIQVSYLKIKPFHKEDIRTYICRGVNSINSCSSKIQIIEPSVPDQPTNLKIDFQIKYIILSWTPGFANGFKQKFIVTYGSHNERTHTEITYDTELRIEIAQLTVKTYYSFSVSALNKIGGSMPSNTLKYLVPAENEVSGTPGWLIAILSIMSVIIVAVGGIGLYWFLRIK